MQTRRKKYSVVNRPGGVPSPFGTNPIAVSPFGHTPVPVPAPALGFPASPAVVSSTEVKTPVDSAGDAGALTNGGVTTDGLMNDIDMVVSHDPGRASSMFHVESRLQKSSVVSMYQDPQSAGDKIEMRLLVSDETERSQVMHKLVSAFQHKVLLCFDHYKPDLTLYCLRIVTSLSAYKPRQKSRASTRGDQRDRKSPQYPDPFAELDIEEALARELPNFTVSRLRSTVQQLLRRATLRQDGTLYFAGNSEVSMATKSVQYFIWFFDFMDYLQELFVNFVEKIFTPLFKYFHDYHSFKSNGRTNSVSSAFSKLSQFSESDIQGSPEGEENDDNDGITEATRMRAQAKASLLQLSKEYRDIKSIYDTSEIDKVAQRLSFVKEQLDYLLDEEDEVDPDLYSEESRKMVEHLDMDFGTQNLIRFVPDILVKLKKAAWLARRWLELDDQRTKDVSIKLQKLASIEEQLVKRLDMLHDDISRGERKLEKETNELNRLMEKEGRSDLLTFKTYNVDSDIQRLEAQLQKLSKERDGFASKLSGIVKAKDLKEFHRLKFRFESNKLQRFMVERKLATLKYQKNLLADDLNLELFVRPSVIHSSNKLQDECERLEKQLREQKEEVVSIKRALMPVQEDKESLMHRVTQQRQIQPPWQAAGSGRLSNMLLHPGHAMYVRSLAGGRSPHPSPHSHRRMIRQIPIGNNRALRTVSPPAW